MKFAIDSNILVYAFIRDDAERHFAAVHIVKQAVDADCVLPVQVIGEFLNVVRRKHRALFGPACELAERWLTTMQLAETSPADLIAAARLAERHRIQFWDSVLCSVARSAGARYLLTEDLQDGRDVDGLRIMNPFVLANRRQLAEMLLPLDGLGK